MLLNSLIFLLLSNSITSRRDTSKLYSRVLISILLIAALISYDNLSFLFLAKGVGIFGGLLHVTATTILFHTFLMTIAILLLVFNIHYETDFILFIMAPRTIVLVTTSIPILCFILNLFYNILLSEQSVNMCAYFFTFFMDRLSMEPDEVSIYKETYKCSNGDYYLTNKMDTNNPIEQGYSSTGSDPTEGRAESYRKMIPDPKNGGFTPINVREEIYDVNNTKISTINYERVTIDGKSKLKVQSIDFFDENGTLLKRKTFYTPEYLNKKN